MSLIFVNGKWQQASKAARKKKSNPSAPVSSAGTPRGARLTFKPTYGVGYWMRGVAEPILIAKRPGAASIRSNWIGLLCEAAEHSRKPDSLYDWIEGKDGDTKFPEPYLSLFSRRRREGWKQNGCDLPGDEKDIRVSLRERVEAGEKFGTLIIDPP
jgi:hypothetical protein